MMISWILIFGKAETYSETSQASKVKFFIINYFRKKLQLGYFTRF